MKQETPLEDLLSRITEPEFFRTHETLTKLTYQDTPNYVWFHLQLKSIALRNKFLEDDPFDWEPGGESYETCCKPPPRKPKKKKRKGKPTGVEDHSGGMQQEEEK